MDDQVPFIFVLLALFVALLGLIALVGLLLGVFDGSTDENHENKRKTPGTTLIIVGSGGHTTEILRLVAGLGDMYCPRHYIIATTDRISEEKIHSFHASSQVSQDLEYHIHKIARSREVKQSWISTVVSTLYACTHSIPLVFRLKPDLILCNGPGTCVPPCFTAALMRMLYITPVKIIYVESICRVLTLSVSAKLLYRVVDHMLVQWPQLQRKYPRTKYIGRLV